MIIDAHCHLGAWPQFHVPDASLATILRTMDQLGIARAIAAPLASLIGLAELGFREGLAAYRESRGRILLYAVFDPRWSDSLDFVRRSLQEPAVVGIKIHPAMHEYPADDDCWRGVWELAAERRLPILSHSWCVSDYNPVQKYAQPHLFARYMREFPQVPLILGHAGGRYEGHLAAAALARAHENVYLDLAGDSYGLGLVEYLAAQVGADRILYGSDLTWIDPRTQLGMILDADVPAVAKQKILGETAARLFGLSATASICDVHA
jgi:predicted TIM-barrel fold metal-dependent hydrolase